MSDLNQDLNPPPKEWLDVPPGCYLVVSATVEGAECGQTLLKDASFAISVAASLCRRTPDLIVCVVDSEGKLIFDSTETDVWDQFYDPI